MSLTSVLSSLRLLTVRPDVPEATDGELLARFWAAPQGAAFRALVRRHGPIGVVARHAPPGQQEGEGEQAGRPASSAADVPNAGSGRYDTHALPE